MKFDWDEEKNAANIRKHKIDFSDVLPIFASPMLIERRQDTTRIISARKANQHERKKYEQAIGN